MSKQKESPRAWCAGTGYDTHTGVGYWVLGIRDLRGKTSHMIVPFACGGQGENAILEAIGRAGYPVPILRSERSALLADITSKTPEVRFDVASRSGWVDDAAFITPHRIYAPGDHRLVPNFGPSMANHRFGCAGTLKDWQTEVAMRVHGNPIAMFAIAAAFASPLMDLLGVESGGFHLVGPSSIGKSSVLVPAGSVWVGGAPIGDIDSCFVTGNALDDIAAAHNCCFLGLDETRLAGETPKEAAATVLHGAYRLTGGEEKARKSDQGQRQSWRVLFLGSAEAAPQELAQQAQQTLAIGQLVRIVGIQADAGRGLGVWEKIPPCTSPANFSDTVRSAAMRHYGTAADAFLEMLVAATAKDRSGLITWLEARMTFFQERLGANQWQGAEARIARRFALVYAAGALAHKYRVLPWKKKDLSTAIHECYRRILVPKDLLIEHTPERSVAAVRAFIENNRDRFIDLRAKGQRLSRTDFSAAKGIIFPGRHEDTEYLFTHQQFRNAVCSGLSPERVLGDMRAAGLLNTQGRGKNTVTRNFPGPYKRGRVISVKSKIFPDQ